MDSIYQSQNSNKQRLKHNQIQKATHDPNQITPQKQYIDFSFSKA